MKLTKNIKQNIIFNFNSTKHLQQKLRVFLLFLQNSDIYLCNFNKWLNWFVQNEWGLFCSFLTIIEKYCKKALLASIQTDFGFLNALKKYVIFNNKISLFNKNWPCLYGNIKRLWINVAIQLCNINKSQCEKLCIITKT